MEEDQSIRSHVLAVLEREFPHLQTRFGVQQLRLFGSVSRGEDTAESDIDLLYTFDPEMDTYDNLFDLHEYLTNLLGRRIELVSEEWSGERFLQSAMRDAVSFENRSNKGIV
ncbi:MAG TPA: nucleotidyltransferase domain-containing protein [Methanocorpusculum sp.]|nr:nucleotidyltransferase domain-containing protein [Methanocorpusculum sp.]